MERVSQAAVRDITRRLQNVVRSDWDFTKLPASGFANPPKVDAVTYRERYYGTTDGSEDEYSTDDIFDAHEILEDEERDPYQFDSPDDVGGIIECKLQARKRKKRRLLEEELQYNEGLCFFLARRNAWTGAKAKSDVETLCPRGTQAVSLPAGRPDSTSSDSGFSSENTDPTSAPSSPRTTDSPTPTPITALEARLRTTSLSPSNDPFRCPNPPGRLTDILLPVSRPLIPTSNPVRTSMTSRSYSELYEKVVRDNRSPAIPINLAHMTHVIVQGWKDEGNWPPQSTMPEAAIAVRRAAAPLTTARNRVQKSIGVRKDSGGEVTAEGESHGILANHRHIRSGIDGVKRVFRLSGGLGSNSRPKSTDSKSTEPRSPMSPTSPRSKSGNEG